MLAAPSDITRLLQRWSEGDSDAFDQLVPIVYDRLRQLARQRLRAAPGATLDTAGLVHEAYLKLAVAPQTELRDRAHFLAVASRVMRNLLTDHARARRAAKRGGGIAPQELLEEAAWMPDDSLDAVRHAMRCSHVMPASRRVDGSSDSIARWITPARSSAH